MRDVELQLAALMATVRERVKTAALEVHPELTPLGYKLLWQLFKKGAQKPGELAAVLGVDRSIISRQTRQLEGLALVRSESDSADGRARVLELTEAARGILGSADQTGRSSLWRNLSEWSDDDLREFARLLSKLNGRAD